MLRFTDGPTSRRTFLKVGSLALGGWTLADLLAARAAEGGLFKERSVVFVFMHGGPPQTETFDPKMTAPRGIRSVTGEVRTTIPGVTFGGTFERLARLAGKLAVVRSFVTGDGNHNLKPLVCPETLGANMGSLYARVAGTVNPHTGMPRNAALFPRAVEPGSQPANMNFGRFTSSGTLGAAYAPFVPGAGSELQGDLELRIPRARLDDRRSLLERLDRLRREADAGGLLEGVDRFREQAFATLLAGVADAFDLSREDPRVLDRYDTSRLVRADRISKRWNNHRNYLDHVRSLGKLMLLARRLCERGAGFVTVTTNFVWDMHADRNNATIEEGMGYVGAPFDHAVSAFIEDCEARGLGDRILLVACGEMGRTPKVNRNGGRDHWGRLAPLLLYGGGLQRGVVIGASTRDAGEPAGEPVRIENLVATIFHSLFDIGRLRVERGLPVKLVEAATGPAPIRGLLT